jgi:hypothetical protein
MPDIQTDPFITAQLLQGGSTLTNPYEARVYDNGLGSSYSSYANAITNLASQRQASEQGLYQKAFDSIGSLIGQRQEQAALDDLAGKLDNPYQPDAIDRAGQSAPLYPNSQSRDSSPVALKPTDAPGTLSPNAPRAGITASDILRLGGLSPANHRTLGLAVNAGQAAQKRADEKARKQEEASLELQTKKASALELGINPDSVNRTTTPAVFKILKAQTDAKATKELGTKLGKQLTTEFEAATTLNEKRAVIDTFAQHSDNPTIKNALIVLDRNLRLGLYGDTVGARVDAIDAGTARTEAGTRNTDARTKDIETDNLRQNKSVNATIVKGQKEIAIREKEAAAKIQAIKDKAKADSDYRKNKLKADSEARKLKAEAEAQARKNKLTRDSKKPDTPTSSSSDPIKDSVKSLNSVKAEVAPTSSTGVGSTPSPKPKLKVGDTYGGLKLLQVSP